MGHDVAGRRSRHVPDQRRRMRHSIASPLLALLVSAWTMAEDAPICADVVAGPPSMFVPRGEPAQIILDITWLVLGICAAIFLVMATLITLAIVRNRAKPGETGEPPQVYGANPIELAWTVIPLIIVLVLFMVSARGIFEIERGVAPEGSLEVTVVGHRWWWEFDYGDLGFVTAGELHVPIDDDHPADMFLTLESADVIHSFWVPQLGGKTDVVPGRINHLWLQADRPGKYVGQCAEYCGNQHANMLITVIVEPREAFDAWVANQQAMARQIPNAELEFFDGGHLFLMQDRSGFPKIAEFLRGARG